ncbi:MAG TPA: HlyD family secretion protein [Xanthobacteraceae bacterium]|jgi:membrane fusion protein (multidrug efflux system)
MAEPVLKLAPPPQTAPSQRKRPFLDRHRRRARFILLAVIPALALALGIGFYLSGGRYISTDNAYVGAEKVLITPDVSGKIRRVLVHEGQHVAASDPLFEIDPVPFELALRQAQSKVASVRTDLANLKSNYGSLSRLVALGEDTVEIRRHDVERKSTLVANRSGTQVDLDNAKAAQLTAELQLQLGRQQLATTLNQLLGSPDLPLESFPAYQQAKAALDQAQRDLDHAVIKAPIAGTATQVDSIQLGRFVTAGMPVFSVIDDQLPWVDANPKETDITYLRVGQKVDIGVDTFPDHAFHGTVSSVSPGTGAQFAILPPQNANGNWVKVVQRVPVRIAFDPGQDLSLLRAGMSVTVYIDTGRRRTFASLIGVSPSAAREIRQ